ALLRDQVPERREAHVDRVLGTRLRELGAPSRLREQASVPVGLHGFFRLFPRLLLRRVLSGGERKLLRSGDHEALQRRVRRRQDLRLLDGLREPARARETDVGKKRAPLLLVVLSVALA